MKNPKIAQKLPYVQELKVGTYYQCSCGLSTKQPFCDGSHQGTKFAPNQVIVEETKIIALCGCKQSSTAFCDGSHTKL